MTAARQVKTMTLQHRGKETLATSQLKGTAMRGLAIQKKKKKKGLLNIKEPGSIIFGFSICIPFTAFTHVQLSHDAKGEKQLLG